MWLYFSPEFFPLPGMVLLFLSASPALHPSCSSLKLTSLEKTFSVSKAEQAVPRSSFLLG